MEHVKRNVLTTGRKEGKEKKLKLILSPKISFLLFFTYLFLLNGLIEPKCLFGAAHFRIIKWSVLLLTQNLDGNRNFSYFVDMFN